MKKFNKYIMPYVSTSIIAIGMVLFVNTETTAINNDLCDAIYDQCMANNPFNRLFQTEAWFGYTIGCANSRSACTEILG